MENKNESYIEVKLSPKGKYYWAIKCGFDRNTAGYEEKVIGAVVSTVSHIDKDLRDKFPKNTAEIQSTSNRYSEVEEF